MRQQFVDAAVQMVGQHECDHLDGIVYPMRMTDLSLLAYNDESEPLAREVAPNPAGARALVRRGLSPRRPSGAKRAAATSSRAASALQTCGTRTPAAPASSAALTSAGSLERTRTTGISWRERAATISGATA